MEETLNEVNNAALKDLAEELGIQNDNLDNVLGSILGDDVDIRDILSYKDDFEKHMRCGKDAISNFEKYVIEHPTEFDNKIIEEFEYQKDLFEFRKEILKDVFKEAFKMGLPKTL